MICQLSSSPSLLPLARALAIALARTCVYAYSREWLFHYSPTYLFSYTSPSTSIPLPSPPISFPFSPSNSRTEGGREERLSFDHWNQAAIIFHSRHTCTCSIIHYDDDFLQAVTLVTWSSAISLYCYINISARR